MTIARTTTISGIWATLLSFPIAGAIAQSAFGAAPASAPASAAPLTLYVSPAGNDTFSGRRSEPNAAKTDGPLATSERARDEIRSQKAAGGLKAGATVLIRGGRYCLAQPLRFLPDDSGTAEQPIVYAAFPGEKPILSGGRAIMGWKKGDGSLWQAEIPAVRNGQWYFTQLFVNGQRRQCARIPNEGYLRSEGPAVEYKRDRNTIGGKPEIRNAIRFKSGDLRPDWRNLEDVNLFLYHSWTNSLHWIDQIDEANHVARFTNTSGWPVSWWEKEQRYHVENVHEGLDAPGEWYLDRKTGLLEYFPMPGEDMTKAEVIAPVLGQLVVVEGRWEDGRLVHDLVLRGLGFEHAEWSIVRGGKYFAQAPGAPPPSAPQAAPQLDKKQLVDGQAADPVAAAVQVCGAERVSLENCRVAHVGGYGLWLTAGCKHNRIVHSEFCDLGAGGVRIGETMRQRTKSKDNTVQGAATPEMTLDGTGPRDTAHNVVDNNFIHQGGRIFSGGVGVIIGHSPYNEVTHNEICDLFYTGVSVGWVWGFGQSAAHHNRICDNHIHHLGWGVMSDMAGVYSLGPSPGTVVAHNLVHHVNAYSYGGWGLYTDEGSSDIVLENNLVYDTKTGGFHQHYGRDNIVRNNIFAFSREGQIQRSREDVKCSFALERNIVYCDNDRVLVGAWRNGDYRLDGNVYWTTSDAVPLFGNRDFDEWRAGGQDQHSLLADPKFVDAQKRDFRLQPDSPALKLGFQPISLEGIGLYGDPQWQDAPKKIARAEFNLPATAAPMPSSIADDFESTPVGQQAAGAVTHGERGEAGIRVTEETAASGKHSLKFTDAAGLDAVYQPHLYYTLNGRKGISRDAFDVRLEPGAIVRHEWRDSAKPYHTGPAIQFQANGDLLAGRTKLMTVPLGQWIHVEITCGLGPDATGTYDLAVTVPGQPVQKFEKLPCGSKDFNRLQWYGFMSNADRESVFYLDHLKLSPAK